MKVRFILVNVPQSTGVIDTDFSVLENENDDIGENMLLEDGSWYLEKGDTSLQYHDRSQDIAKYLLEWYLSENRLRQVALLTYLMTQRLIESGSEVISFREAESHFCCPICREIFVNAMMCRYCGRSYCRPCLYEWLGRNDHCPTCNYHVVDRRDFVPNRELRNIVHEYCLTYKLPLINDLAADPDLAVPPPAVPADNGDLIPDPFPPRTWKEFFILTGVTLIPVVGPSINIVMQLSRGNPILSLMNMLFLFPDLFCTASFLSSFNLCKSLSHTILGEDRSSLVKSTLDSLKGEGVSWYNQGQAKTIATVAVSLAVQRFSCVVGFKKHEQLVKHFCYFVGFKSFQVLRLGVYFWYHRNL
jgi:hypothetical protein